MPVRGVFIMVGVDPQGQLHLQNRKFDHGNLSNSSGCLCDSSEYVGKLEQVHSYVELNRRTLILSLLHSIGSFQYLRSCVQSQSCNAPCHAVNYHPFAESIQFLFLKELNVLSFYRIHQSCQVAIQFLLRYLSGPTLCGDGF